MCRRTTGFKCWSQIVGLELRDVHAEFSRAFDQMFPGERAGSLRGERVGEWHGVMVVQQEEVIADRQSQSGLDDQAVFDGAG